MNPHQITGDQPPTPFLSMDQLEILQRLYAKEILYYAFKSFASTTMDKTAAEVLGQAMNRKPSNGKSVWCTMVLRLMDTEEYSNNYCRSLALVLELFPEVNRKELEKELDKYI